MINLNLIKLFFFSSAESIFNIPLVNPATLRSDGQITWEGPVIFRSSCHVNVGNFPFDEQNCTIKLGPWTYHSKQVDMVLVDLCYKYIFRVKSQTFPAETQFSWNLVLVLIKVLKNFRPSD